MTFLWSDLRPALRSLPRAPGATLLSLAVLSLGIGVATALASLCESVVLRPWPVRDASRLVRVQALHPIKPGDAEAVRRGLCPLDMQDLERAPGLLERPFYFESNIFRIQSRNATRSALGVFVTEQFFTAIACFIPALRAARTDPMNALRSE